MQSKAVSRGARATAAVIALALWTTCPRAVADHCPESVVAAGLPETSLAGIGFQLGGFPAVRAALGRPSQVEVFAVEGGPPGSGEARYRWQLASTRLEVWTAFHDDRGSRVETVDAVRLDGTKSRRRFTTGRGLRLGDSRSRVAQLYGSSSIEGSVNGPTLPGRTVTYCFTDETELSIGLSASGRVTAIWLAPSAD